MISDGWKRSGPIGQPALGAQRHAADHLHRHQQQAGPPRRPDRPTVNHTRRSTIARAIIITTADAEAQQGACRPTAPTRRRRSRTASAPRCRRSGTAPGTKVQSISMNLMIGRSRSPGRLRPPLAVIEGTPGRGTRERSGSAPSVGGGRRGLGRVVGRGVLDRPVGVPRRLVGSGAGPLDAGADLGVLQQRHAHHLAGPGRAGGGAAQAAVLDDHRHGVARVVDRARRRRTGCGPSASRRRWSLLRLATLS